MKVRIGPYVNWVGPYQIAEKLLFWKDKYEDHSVHEFGKKLAKIKPLVSLCEWVYNKKDRKVKIKLDPWDHWSADHTLSLIIHPLLVKLKECKHGDPQVDNEDVPEALRGEMDPVTYQIDNNWSERWDYVIDEMIWTFAQLAGDGDGEQQFYSGKSDILWEPCGADGEPVGPPKKLEEDLDQEIESKALIYCLVNGPKHTFKIDTAGLAAYDARIANGLRLFGKYYRALWD